MPGSDEQIAAQASDSSARRCDGRHPLRRQRSRSIPKTLQSPPLCFPNHHPMLRVAVLSLLVLGFTARIVASDRPEWVDDQTERLAESFEQKTTSLPNLKQIFSDEESVEQKAERVVRQRENIGPRHAGESWDWEFLPQGLLYHSYLAGEKEPRFAQQVLHQGDRGWIWEVTLGARVGLVRYGTPSAVDGEGWQLDLEGAAMPRLDLQQQEDVDAVDFRFGVPLTYRQGPVSWKFGYYHISSHLGDELMLKRPDIERINYVRESFVLGVSYEWTEWSRCYSELGYAFSRSGGARPLELQTGLEWGALRTWNGRNDSPFAAVNLHSRQDNGMNPGVNAMAGWQWRGVGSNHLFRVGGQFYRGPSLQYEFLRQREQLVGFGTWLDF